MAVAGLLGPAKGQVAFRRQWSARSHIRCRCKYPALLRTPGSRCFSCRSKPKGHTARRSRLRPASAKSPHRNQRTPPARKISSCATRIFAEQSPTASAHETSPSHRPPESSRFPPVSTFAPLVFPISNVRRHCVDCCSLMHGPISVGVSSPLPTFKCFTRSTSRLVNSHKRSCEPQRDWPPCNAAR